ncbi:MAG TPA: haloalkane dehalogenase, partial [bacterium]|nr:haloalkane dehalogenase [bacterium]
KSDKPDIPYRLFDHATYFDGFVEAMGLQGLRLVLHDWGGFLGLHYAARHPDNVKAIAMMEAVLRPARMAERSEAFQRTFGMLRGPQGREKIMRENFFVERILPGSVLRKLGEQEMARYREPFATEQSRKPTYVFPNEIPLDGQPADVTAAVEHFDQALALAGIPMLLLTFTPGAIVLPPDVEWCRRQFPTLTVREMGPGVHFVQEDQPAAIGKALAEWFRGLP